ncbi:sel1 repeat family protein [Salmonella enterica]|nr:sel1 repeat family protein [Salmonella enterica]EAR4310915.1 sel1 repeat family protein [Salmonella enterica]EBA6491279.1 sel1 repeat family protein [Salmonella enterica]EGV1917734.1 sel1 repeat family protein [Salmonella enterica]
MVNISFINKLFASKLPILFCDFSAIKVFMKSSFYIFLLSISTPVFSQSIVIDPTSAKTKADDANSIANMYRMGMGVPKDMKKAFELYQVAAELGNTDAQVDLGDMYYSGEETSQSYEKANYWYEKAAKNNSAKAQMYLGYAYLNGKGVAVDYDKAKNFLELAVKQGEPSAMYHLGTMFFDGKGVTKDQNQAIPLFKKSCSEGDSNACDKLKEIKIEK